MSQILKPIALDESVQITNQKIDNLNTQIVNAMGSMTNELIGLLASVKSINGKYGIVVLDSGDILITKDQGNSKTIKQMLTEMNDAIALTPLSFSTELITGTAADYTLNIVVGTPA